METVLLVLLVAAAGFACPAMMWWQRRRARTGGGKPSGGRQEDPSADLGELRARRDRLAARIAELETDEQHDVTPSAR